MAEPINPIPNPEAPKPKQLIIGETPVYFSTPQEIDGKTIESFLILDSDTRASALSGIGTSTILMKEPSRKRGEKNVLVDKPLLHTNKMDPVDWDKVSGIRYTDANNEIHDIPKEQLSLDPTTSTPEAGLRGTSPASLSRSESADGVVENMQQETLSVDAVEPVVDILEAAQKQKESPVLARAVLETLQENPNTITIVGLKAYETRARDLAARSMQTLVTPAQKDMSEAQNRVWEKSKDAVKKINTIGRVMWKQSIGGTYFQERARQYYMDMLKAAETPFAEDAIKMAESRAKITYDKLLADKNFIARAGTKTAEWAKDAIGMRTMIQKLALAEIGNMKVAGEIKGIESFDREAKAVRLRFSQDMDKADIFVRTSLGEKLDILDPADEAHKPLVDGIKGLMKDYATGEIADKKTFDEKAKEFFKTTLKDARPDVFAEAELYSSSLFDAAETLRAKASHEGGMANIDADLSAMQVRLGLAQMGEVTSLIPSQVEGATKKILDMVESIKSKSGPLYSAFFNEVTIGTAVALASTSLNLVKTAPFRALGLGALAGGTYAGFREYGALQREYLTHLREREAGDTFGESMKRRNFFEKYLVNQRSAEDMIGKIQTSLYEPDGAMKVTLSDDELRMSLATITDITARKAVSETPAIKKVLSPDKRIGLIRFSERESIETQRTALDVTSHKALTDIETYLSTHTEQATDVLGGTTLEDFMVKLTTNQTTVLKDGANTLANITEDPIRNVLGLVAEHAPEINMLKRRFPLGVRALPPEQQILGMDAILDQFTRDARVEAVKYGIKAGAIGAGVGVVIHGIGEALQHVPSVVNTATENVQERVTNIDHPATFAPEIKDIKGAHFTAPYTLSPSTPDHTVILNGKTYELPQELQIDTIKTGFGGETTYNAKLDFPDTYTALHDQPDISFGEHLSALQLKDVLHKAGIDMVDGKTTSEILSPPHAVDIPNLLDPAGKNITMQLPSGYSIEPQGDHYAILFNKHIVADNLQFNPDGSLENATALKLPDTLHYDAGTTHVVPLQHNINIPAENQTPHIETPPPPTGDMTLDGDKLGNGGIWDHFLGKTSGENAVSTANGEKNLFRLYEHYMVPHNADGTPTNITFGENNANPYNHVAHLRDATLGSEKVQEFDISKIANDAHITNLPKELFGTDAIDKFGDLNDAAIKHYQDLVAQGHSSSEALTMLESSDKLQATVLKLSYFDDSKLPTEAELAPLLKELGYTHVIPTGGPTIIDTGLPSVPEVIPTTKIHEVVISAVPTETVVANHIGATDPLVIPYMTASENAEVVQQVAERLNGTALVTEKSPSSLPWLPIFLPFRSSLEREYIAPPEASTIPVTNSEFLSPFGGEEMYLTKALMEARKSPRLTENPEAQLASNEEINWYLSTLSETDKQTIDAFVAQHETPMAAEVIRVVAIPTVSANASQVYQTLTQYTTQTDPAGTLLDPKQTEIVILNRTATLPIIEGQEPTPFVDTMKTEIDRFRTDHPELSVVYLTKEYPDDATIGLQKRDLSNTILQRMAARGETNGDASIINAFVESNALSPTYLSTISTTLENPMTDMVNGSFKVPLEAYAQFPMLFAPMRLQELFDSMVRHGESKSMPNVISGNTAVRASTLAAVGGYNPSAARTEDRELAHLIKTARNDREFAVVENKDLTQVVDPKLSLYAKLQAQGVADPAIPLEAHELYKNQTWQELATKATENITKENLEQSVNALYQGSYPTLKQQNPEAFDAYFGRSMDALGLSYEITDGVIHITDDTKLATNMAAELDLEAFAKTTAEDVHTSLTASRGKEEQISPRETLENVAGTTDEQIAEEITTKQETTETAANMPPVESSIASPEILEPEQISQTISSEPTVKQTTQQTETVIETPTETRVTTAEPTISSPEVFTSPTGGSTPEVGSQQVAQNVSTESLASAIETSTPVPEILPEGVTDRINYVIQKHANEGRAAVAVTPNELMEYIQSTVEIPGGRITQGSLSIQNNTVQLNDITIQTPIGKAVVSGNLVDNPTQGLHLDPNSLQTKLDLLLRTQGGKIKEAANNLTTKIKEHFNAKITDPNWESSVMHVNGDTISLTFVKKTTTS